MEFLERFDSDQPLLLARDLPVLRKALWTEEDPLKGFTVFLSIRPKSSLRHQPKDIAGACLLLAARELNLTLPQGAPRYSGAHNCELHETVCNAVT